MCQSGWSPILADVDAELRRATAKFGSIASTHEGYAVTLEELDEFWEGVRTKGTPDSALYEELVQVAAMAVRTALDCELRPLTARVVHLPSGREGKVALPLGDIAEVLWVGGLVAQVDSDELKVLHVQA